MKQSKLKSLTAMIAKLEEKKALELTRQLIEDNTDPLQIIEYSHQGMTEVGLQYEKGIYFISGLIMAGEIMQQVSQQVLPLTKGTAIQTRVGQMVIGTVEGDIHHIGKDIFKVFLCGHGFIVHDLGVDVPKQKFLSAIHEFKPDIVGTSCLISTCIDALAETISFLKENVPSDMAPKAYVAGGHLMKERVCKTVGADFCTTDSMEGVRLCQQIMKQ